MADTNNQTIIIKKVKKRGHGGGHGGAWKVAYADFVTAMMAFFLLMWLLNATEAESLSGLADYFAPTVGISGNMGIGFRGGKAILSKGVGADKNTNKGIVFGGVPTGPIVKVTEVIEQKTEEADAEKINVLVGKPGTTEKNGESDTEQKNFTEMAQALQSYINDTARENGMESAVKVVETPEGLEVQVRDVQGEAMFREGTAELQPKIKEVLTQLAGIVRNLPNYIAITGHTSSVPVHGKPGYSNWELSADRANAARRFLMQSGIQPEQIERIVGRADNEPVDAKHPAAAVNNRLSIVLLRRAMVPEYKKGAPEGVFLDPKSSEAQDLMKDDEKKKPVAPLPEKKEEKDTKAQENVREVIDSATAPKDTKTIIREEMDDRAARQQEKKDAQGKPVEKHEDAAKAALEAKEVQKKKETPVPVNAHLLDQKEENVREFQSLPVQDPLTNGGAINPLQIKEEIKKTQLQETPPSPNASLLEKFKTRDKDIGKFQNIEVQDPLSSGTAINPLEMKEEAKKLAPKTAVAPNAALLKKLETRDENIREFQNMQVHDPLSNGESADPFSLKEEAKPKVPARKNIAPNTRLLEDQDEGKIDEFQNLMVQDPLSSGSSINPLIVPGDGR